jgi:hypothetical protein
MTQEEAGWRQEQEASRVRLKQEKERQQQEGMVEEKRNYDTCTTTSPIPPDSSSISRPVWFYPCTNTRGDNVESGFRLIISHDMTIQDVRMKITTRLRESKVERYKIFKIESWNYGATYKQGREERRGKITRRAHKIANWVFPHQHSCLCVLSVVLFMLCSVCCVVLDAPFLSQFRSTDRIGVIDTDAVDPVKKPLWKLRTATAVKIHQ